MTRKCELCNALLTWEEELCVDFDPEEGVKCSMCLYDDGIEGLMEELTAKTPKDADEWESTTSKKKCKPKG